MKTPRINDFDPNPPEPPTLASPLDGMPAIEKQPKTSNTQEGGERKSVIPPTSTPEKATMTPRYQATVVPSNHDTTIPDQTSSFEEVIRKAVKQVGKEAATYRFTEAEKQALADIEYRYKRQGIRTSGNEITRIGLNFLVEDHHRNGEQSILAKTLKLLNS